jgi:hypothetical protein
MTQSNSPPLNGPVGPLATQEALPHFYRKIAALDAVRYAGKSLKTSIGFSFARAAHAVMLNTVEFERAAPVYPIVFTSAPNPAALALLGLREAENLFVDLNGEWKPNAYIPAYVRRYPFIFHRSQDGQRYTLCIDEAADALEAGGARPLFSQDGPSEVAKAAMNFCAAFQRDNEETRAFVMELAKNQLLMKNQAQVKLNSGEALSLSGFEMIDRAKFDALAISILDDWRKRGWLGLVYAHFISLASFADLVDRASAKQALL